MTWKSREIPENVFGTNFWKNSCDYGFPRNKENGEKGLHNMWKVIQIALVSRYLDKNMWQLSKITLSIFIGHQLINSNQKWYSILAFNEI